MSLVTCTVGYNVYLGTCIGKSPDISSHSVQEILSVKVCDVFHHLYSEGVKTSMKLTKVKLISILIVKRNDSISYILRWKICKFTIHVRMKDEVMR